MSQLLVDFLAKEMPAVPQLIGGGLLPVKGKMVIGGVSKANKSFVGLSIALALSQGTPLFNAHLKSGAAIFPVYKQCRVLYIDQEVGEPSLQDRLRSITSGDDIRVIPFYIKSRDLGMRLDSPEGRQLIGEEIASCAPDVVVFDPLAQFHLSDENSAQEMNAVMRVGDHWIENFGLSIIYIHHAGLPNEDHPRTGGNKLRGSTAIFAAADTIMIVERQSALNAKEPYLKLDFELRHAEPPEQCYVRRMKNGRVMYVGDHLPQTTDTHQPMQVSREFVSAKAANYKGL